MGNDCHDLTLDDVKAGASSDTLLDPELTLQCMNATMGYYITLHKIVTRKLQYATQATNRCINELEADAKPAGSLSAKRAARYQLLEDDLSRLKNILEDMQVSVEELEAVDQVFFLLPGKVKLYFDYLVNLDAELIAMVNEISSEEYKQAYRRALKIVELVQDGKDILSGCPLVEVQDGPDPVRSRQVLAEKPQAVSRCNVAEDGKLVRDL